MKIMILIIGLITTKKITSKSFEYKTKIIGRTADDNNTLDAEDIFLLYYFSRFWRFPDFQLNNCDIEIYFLWSKECIISEISIAPGLPAYPDAHRSAQEMLDLLHCP